MEEKLQLLYPSLNSDIISIIIEDCELFVLDYCNLTEIPESLESVIFQMCKESISKLQSEGLSSESAGGSNISYLTDFSNSVYKRLKKHKRLKVH